MVAIAAVACVAAVPVIEALRHEDGVIMPGTHVGAVDVGGLRLEVARGVVARHAARLAERGVSVEVTNTRAAPVHVSGAALGARPRIDEALAQAGERGVFQRVLDVFGIHREHAVPLLFSLSDARVKRLMGRVQAQAGTPARPATVEVVGDQLEVRPGRVGRGVDTALLQKALPTLPATVVLSSRVVAPAVPLAEAERARDQAQALLDAPPTLVAASGRRVTMRPATLRAALQFTPRDGRVEVSLDPARLEKPLAATFPGLQRPQRDADFRVVGERVKIVPDRPGQRIDVAAVAAAALRAPGGEVQVTTVPVAAEVTAARLRSLGVEALVSQYTTEFPCCEPRVTNITRAAQILDGTIIAANTTFSLNRALGERTVERGFVEAPQIANGEFKKGVGGGVSQVATTVFNAAFFAGLELLQHTPHEVYISRYPMGREATVSWGSPDLSFRNDWPAAIYMRVTTTGTSVTVQMFSKKLGRRVEASIGEQTGLVQPKEVRRFDATLDPGTEVVDQSMGGPGFDVAYTRTVYRDGQVHRDERWTWHYRAVDAIIREGPAAPDPPPATTDTSPTPAPAPPAPVTGSTPPPPG